MNEEPKPYVIRRVKKIKKAAHHGGSWKIAYADFVTAMMTFFLLMWLLSMLNKYQLEGVAEYFKKPLEHALQNPGRLNNKDKEKETQKEKPNKVEMKPDKDKNMIGVSDVNKKALPAANKKVLDVKELQKAIENKMQNDPELRQFKNLLNFQVTADGLKIQLHDLENKSMFTTGKADFKNYAEKILNVLSSELNKYPNQIVVIGHTDTAKYQDGNYSNWELSADRANAARRALVHQGLNSDKFLRVIGVGDTELLDKKNGLNPSNRRIEILILSDDAMKKLAH
jgi:chemotaxis protein MotB